jgi:hypothetical protein
MNYITCYLFSDCGLVAIKKNRLGKCKEGIVIALGEIKLLKDLSGD